MTTILNVLPIANSKNFEKNVLKTLPNTVNDIVLDNFGMKRVGTGSYEFYLSASINNEYITLKKFTHDSEAYDTYTDLERGNRNFDNFVKRYTLDILEDNQDEIIEFLED